MRSLAFFGSGVVLFAAITLVVVGVCTSGVSAGTVSIASWNLQVFGTTKVRPVPLDRTFISRRRFSLSFSSS